MSRTSHKPVHAWQPGEVNVIRIQHLTNKHVPVYITGKPANTYVLPGGPVLHQTQCGVLLEDGMGDLMVQDEVGHILAHADQVLHDLHSPHILQHQIRHVCSTGHPGQVFILGLENAACVSKEDESI